MMYLSDQQRSFFSVDYLQTHVRIVGTAAITRNIRASLAKIFVRCMGKFSGTPMLQACFWQ